MSNMAGNEYHNIAKDIMSEDKQQTDNKQEQTIEQSTADLANKEGIFELPAAEIAEQMGMTLESDFVAKNLDEAGPEMKAAYFNFMVQTEGLGTYEQFIDSVGAETSQPFENSSNPTPNQPVDI